MPMKQLLVRFLLFAVLPAGAAWAQTANPSPTAPAAAGKYELTKDQARQMTVLRGNIHSLELALQIALGDFDQACHKAAVANGWPDVHCSIADLSVHAPEVPTMGVSDSTLLAPFPFHNCDHAVVIDDRVTCQDSLPPDSVMVLHPEHLSPK